jgi:homoserine O-succinyltransferase/O-acetyltransferase
MRHSMKIPIGVDSASLLASKWPDRISLAPVENEGRKIALLNLMPDKKLQEYLWFDLLAEIGAVHDIVLVKMATYQPRNTAASYMLQNYVDTALLWSMSVDALIITGAPLGAKLNAFEDAIYWSELTQVLDACSVRNIPVLGVCWGGNALFYHKYRIPLRQLSQKVIGVFTHKTGGLARQFGLEPELVLELPVDRQSGFHEADVALSGRTCYELISPSLGPSLVQSSDGLDWAVVNHLEYDMATLLKEYGLYKGMKLDLIEEMQGVLQLPPSADAPWRQTAKVVYQHWYKMVQLRSSV